MLIKRNVYFSAIDQETGEERLFSVNEVLDEETYLERLYSEEEQREFARRDYEGLNEAGKEALRKRRDDYAKQLKTNYRNTMKGIDNVVKPDTNILNTNLETAGGGVKTTARIRTRKGTADSVGKFVKLHKDTTTNEMLKGSASDKDIMRKETLANSSYVAPKKVAKDGSKLIGYEAGSYKQELQKAKAKANLPAVTNAAKSGSKAVTKNSGKLLKRAGIGGAAVLGTAGLAYAGKKLYDKNKKKQ